MLMASVDLAHFGSFLGAMGCSGEAMGSFRCFSRPTQAEWPSINPQIANLTLCVP